MDKVRIYTLEDRFFADERGWAFFPFQGDLEQPARGCHLASLHIVRTEPGGVRGNHRHAETAEWLHIFGGSGRFYWEEDGRTRSLDLSRDNQLIYVPAGVAHTIRCTGPGPLYLVAFRENPTQGPHTEPRAIA